MAARAPAPEDVELLWRAGQLSWKLDACQLEIYQAYHASNAAVFVLNCSRRLGKSYLMCLLALEHCLQHPGSQVRFAAPTAKQVREIVTPLLRTLLRDCPPDLKPNSRSHDGVFIFPNGSELHMAGCDSGNAERLRGTSADLWIVDEAGSVDDLKYVTDDVLMPQTLTTDGRGIVASTPPRTPAHAFKSFADAAIADGAYVHRTIYHNPRVSAETIARFMKQAGGKDSSTWKREYLAQFVVDEESAVIPEFSPEEHVGAVDRPAWFDAYEAMDVGFIDLTVVLFAYWHWGLSKLVIEDELVLSRMTTQQLAEGIKYKEDRLAWNKAPYMRVSDVNHIVLADLRLLHGLPFRPTRKDDKEAAVNALRMAVHQGKILVHPRCVRTIHHLTTAVWNKERTEFERSGAKDSDGHFDAVDALVYMWRNVNRNRNPNPSLAPGITPTTHVMEEYRAQQRQKRGLRDLVHSFLGSSRAATNDRRKR